MCYSIEAASHLPGENSSLQEEETPSFCQSVREPRILQVRIWRTHSGLLQLQSFYITVMTSIDGVD